jgi:uncharacterized membrane protein (DUF4010 family)
MILATKKHIRSFFDRIDHYELLDGLKFAVILFVVLPLLPDQDAYGATSFTEAFFNPHSVWKFVVIMTGIWYIGYLLKKIVGNTGGIQTLWNYRWTHIIDSRNICDGTSKSRWST